MGLNVFQFNITYIHLVIHLNFKVFFSTIVIIFSNEHFNMNLFYNFLFTNFVFTERDLLSKHRIHDTDIW